MNKLDIQTIVEDILRLDPTLVSKKAEVEKLITAMLAQKPNITVDDAFLSRLRSRLVDQMRDSQSKSFSFGQLFVSHKLAFAGVLGCLTVGIVSASLLYSPVQNTRMASVNGFGSLTMQDAAKDMATLSSATSVTSLDSVSDVSASMIEPAVSRMQSGGGLDAATKMMIYPPIDGEYGQYSFVFDGDMAVPPEQMDVYGYVPSKEVNRIVDKAISTLWGTVFNAQSVDVQGQSLGGIISVDSGSFMVSVDAQRGVSYLSRFEPYSASTEIQCFRAPCNVYQPFEKKDVPADSVIVGWVQSLVDELGIDVTLFGEPKVIPPVVYTIMNESGTSIESVGEMVDVIYPLVLDGVTTVDSSGVSNVGLRVSVDLRTQRVNSISELPLGDLGSSAYELVTDVSRIEVLAELGGQYGMWGIKTKTPVVLSAPTLVYTSIWKQDKEVPEGRSLLVPAYRFEIVYPDEIRDRQFMQQAIVISLEKELFEQAERDALSRQNQGDYPVPMPLIKTMELGN
jgi:hypothetical protein